MIGCKHMMTYEVSRSPNTGQERAVVPSAQPRGSVQTAFLSRNSFPSIPNMKPAVLLPLQCSTTLVAFAIITVSLTVT